MAVCRGVATVTVGAGVAGGGDELWAHPAKRIQSMSVRKARGRKAFFMARDLRHGQLTFRSFSPVIYVGGNHSSKKISSESPFFPKGWFKPDTRITLI